VYQHFLHFGPGRQRVAGPGLRFRRGRSHQVNISYGFFPASKAAGRIELADERTFGAQGGAIAAFARVTGVELARRRDLLPEEVTRSEELYYKVQFRRLIEKDPPIVNEPRRSVSFIRTTWDRFISADAIPDLYSEAGFHVDRLYYALGS